jgi:osmoprotectant transport system ATP-binding protein
MIEFKGVSRAFNGKAAVSDLSLTVAEGEFCVLLGTSGSGKSTTLKMINRLVEFDSGEIRFAGESIRQLDARDLRRRMGYAIQSIGLFPHWTVQKNIATVPALLGWSKQQVTQRIAALLALLNLDPQLLNRYPHQLSGGQQQRVGVARALAADPEVLLMDEPFGALDPVTRGALQQEMLRIHRLSGRTIVLVTHDIDEALTLADRLVLMDNGEIVQQGKPAELLTQPKNDFVRDFFGRSEMGVRLLALGQVGDAVRRGEWLTGEPIAVGLTLREALSQFITRRTDKLPVIDEQQQPLGVLYFNDLLTLREETACAG